MNKKHFSMLIILAAIWGASFMFMRILSPVLGPVLTASFRLLIGGIVVLAYYKYKGVNLNLKADIKIFLLLGIISFAAPYFLFSWAALYIPSGVSAVLNSTSPMFSFIISMLIFNERINLQKIFGLFIGTLGVYIISINSISFDDKSSILGVLACIGASLFYAISGALIQTVAKHVDSRSLAVGNQLFGGLLLLPLVYFYPLAGEVNINIILTLIVFGVLGSGVASIMYFALMKEVGPLKTLTVTYLLPVFGLFWGYVILDEQLTLSFVIGLILILIGVFSLTNKKA